MTIATLVDRAASPERGCDTLAYLIGELYPNACWSN